MENGLSVSDNASVKPVEDNHEESLTAQHIVCYSFMLTAVVFFEKISAAMQHVRNLNSCYQKETKRKKNGKKE